MFLAALFVVYAYWQYSDPVGVGRWLGVESFGVRAAAILCEALGAVSIFIGYKTQAGAFLLLMIAGRAAWVSAGGADDVNFLKNLAICGGFLTLFASGPGDWSLGKSGGGGGGGKGKTKGD